MEKFSITLPAVDAKEGSTFLKPIRYLIFIGLGYQACKELRQSLKGSDFYCLTDCYKTISGLEKTNRSYLPDCIVWMAKPWSVFFLRSKISRIKEMLPGVKLIMSIPLPGGLRRMIKKKNQHVELITEKKDLLCSLEKILLTKRS